MLTAFALAQQPALSSRPITTDDYFRIREVHDPQLSPDAQSVAYVVKTAILKTDKNEDRIWMIPRSGGDPIALTAEGAWYAHFVKGDPTPARPAPPSSPEPKHAN